MLHMGMMFGMQNSALAKTLHCVFQPATEADEGDFHFGVCVELSGFCTERSHQRNGHQSQQSSTPPIELLPVQLHNAISN